MREGYETGRRMLLRHDPTYYLATRRLPRELRPATHALYGFVRTADQIVDGPRRPPTPDGRRAALDAWEAELQAGRESAAPVVRALADAGDAPPAAARRAGRLHALDADRLRAGADLQLGGAGRLHGRLGRLGRADHGVAAGGARRAIAPTSAGSGSRSSWRTSSATCARTARLDRVYLPASDRERFGVSEDDLAAPAAGPELRALVAHEVARARELFARRRGPRSPPRRARCGRASASRSALYGRMLDRVEAAGFDVLARPGGVRVVAPPGRGAGGAAMRRATLRGAERTPFADERADVLICGASFAGLAVARELAGAGADVLVVDRYEIGERATSACAAPTPWLHAMGVAARDPPGDPVHGVPHAARLGALPAAVERGRASTTASSAWRCGSSATRASRSPRWRAVTARRGPNRPRRHLTAPLIVDALGWRRVLGTGRQRPAARGRDLARPGGPPARRRRRPRRLDRPLARPRRLRLERPGRRRAARRRRLLRAARPRQGADAGDRPPARRSTPSATRAIGSRTGCARRDRGRRLLRRRQRRPLHPAVRRGHPHGVLLRHRRRARAARRARARADASSRPCTNTRDFSAEHAPFFARALALQRAIPRIPPRALTALLSLAGRERLCTAAFGWYLDQIHPRYAVRHVTDPLHLVTT